MNNQFCANRKEIIRFNFLFVLFCIFYMLCGISFIIFGEKLQGIRFIKAYKAENAVQVMNVRKDNYIDTIVIDAGHGGFDIGGKSADGIVEKTINLKISEYLEALFLLSDYKVVMTRKDDRLLYKEGEESRKKYYDLVNRVKIAEDNGKCIFISIHQNIFPSAVCKGFQVYYTKNNPDAKLLAESLQRCVINDIQPENKRAVKPAGSEILILHKTTKIAVLAECGFLSNPQEAALLSTDGYQRKMASSIFRGINEFLHEKMTE